MEESGSEYPTNMASYPSSAIFGQLPSLHSASSSTPSASTSTSDSASPYPTFPKGKRPLPDGMQNFPPFLFGVDPGIPAMSTFLPVNQTDGATPSFPGYPDAGGLAGQLGMETMYSLQNTGIHNMPGQNYDLNHCYSRSNLAGPSRYPSTDTLSLSAPAPSRPPVPSYSSPSHPVAPLPQSQPRPWVPQDRGPWQEPTPPEVLDFSALTAGSAAFSARIKSPDQVQQGPGAEERRQAVLSLSAGMGGSAIEEVPFPQDFSLGLSTGGVQDYPRSAAYPDNLYGSLPDGLVGPDFGAGAVNQGAGTDTGRALEIYEHVLATLPHIRPTRDPPPNPPPLQPLLDLSYEAQSIISKLHPPPIHTDGPTQGQSNGGLPRRHSVNHPAPSGTTTIGTARRAGKEKGTTKCTGCGATETPEWRRGPLGPRTLCNACGLVHMKIQKKKEKQEEKAAAKAAQAQAKTAAAGGDQGSEAAGGRVKRVKREETA